MSTAYYSAATGNDDWEEQTLPSLVQIYTGSSIPIKDTRDVSNIRTEYNIAYVDIDTTALDPTWTINSASLHWYNQAHTAATKDSTESTSIHMTDGGDVWRIIENLTTNRVVGWDSEALGPFERDNWLRPGDIANFRFTATAQSDANEWVSWTVRMSEYDGDGSSGVYLEVDYTDPSPITTRKRIFIIG